LTRADLHAPAADVRGDKVLAVAEEDAVADEVDVGRREVRDARVARVGGVGRLRGADHARAQLGADPVGRNEQVRLQPPPVLEHGRRRRRARGRVDAVLVVEDVDVVLDDARPAERARGVGEDLLERKARDDARHREAAVDRGVEGVKLAVPCARHAVAEAVDPVAGDAPGGHHALGDARVKRLERRERVGLELDRAAVLPLPADGRQVALEDTDLEAALEEADRGDEAADARASDDHAQGALGTGHRGGQRGGGRGGGRRGGRGGRGARRRGSAPRGRRRRGGRARGGAGGGARALARGAGRALGAARLGALGAASKPSTPHRLPTSQTRRPELAEAAAPFGAARIARGQESEELCA
jgi:hypothetical protein